MRLWCSRTADYGLRAALEIARAPDTELVTRRAIAGATNAPSSVLAQALAALVRAGLLDAHAGPRGGYRLARPAADISVRDVVDAIDPQDPEQQCIMRDGSCSQSDACQVHPYLVDAQRRFLETLSETSLAEVIAR